MIDKIILSFKMIYEIERTLLNISPLTFLLINGVGIYWSVGMFILNKPIMELATFGLTNLFKKELKKK